MLHQSLSALPKPPQFKPAGKVKVASRVEMARRTPDGSTINRFKEGLRYERKAIRHLREVFDECGTLIVEPCFRFSNGFRSRFCFPDALLIMPGAPMDLLIEIKTRHTYDAYWQLQHLYYPVVKKAMGRELKLLEVVKSYDPAVQLPLKTKVLATPEEALDSTVPYNIYIYTGR